MSSLPSSRYIDYDYDNECIFGFDADDEDTTNILFSLANDNTIDTKNLSHFQLSVPLIGDIYWRKSKKKRSPTITTPTPPQPNQIQIPQTPISPSFNHKEQQRTPSPISPQSPQTPQTPQIKQQQYADYEQMDQFDKHATDRRLSLISSDPEHKNTMDTIVRTDPFNDELYEAYGTEIICTSYKWRFIMHEESAMIVGLTNADIKGQQQMTIFIDTESNEIQQLFASGRPKQGCAIQLYYDKDNKCVIVENITPDTADKGKQMLCFTNIDTSKRYKLTMVLKKESTITMY